VSRSPDPEATPTVEPVSPPTGSAVGASNAATVPLGARTFDEIIPEDESRPQQPAVRTPMVVFDAVTKVYDPNVVEARMLMAMIYMARGEKKKARSEVEILQKQFPNDAVLYFVKGVIHRLDGEYDESLKAYEKLSRLDPAARRVWRGL